MPAHHPGPPQPPPHRDPPRRDPGRPWPEPPDPERPLPPRPAPRPATPLPAPGGPTLHPAGPAGPDPLLDRLLDERIIYVGHELDDTAADRVITQLLLLGALEPHRDVTLQLNALGGSVTAGLAVYDTLRALGGGLTTRAIGLVGPVTALLLAAGTPGRRHACPHARILLATPGAGSGGVGDPAVRAGVVGPQRQQMTELLARHAGRSVDAVSADLTAQRWLTAPEALEYGLVDVVIEA